MSSKKSQAILKCFIDLKNSVWFRFVTLRTFFSSTAGQGVLKLALNDRQSHILHKFHKSKNPAKPNYDMSIKKSTAKCTEYRTAGHLVF